MSTRSKNSRWSLFPFILNLVLALLLVLGSPSAAPVKAQADDPNPPQEVVKLIFIHHSTGENWLADDYGGLGRALGENNYFVSDTNYGWGPNAIGDRTDIINWPEWFHSPDTPQYMEALFNESEQHASYTRTLPDPGGENQIIMFKSCFPNSQLEGNPDDPAAPGEGLNVGNAKHIYNDLLKFFITRPDKLFVVITAPPVQDSTYADNARAFTTWLMQDWLRENSYPLNNVAVFDFYNVLTHPDNHHRYQNGQIEWETSHGRNTLVYDSDGDDHPNPEGSQKATEEFIPLLNIFYHRWASGAAVQPQPPEQAATSIPPTSPPIVLPPNAGLIDDFESGPPPSSSGWSPNWDEATSTEITCAPQADQAHQGNSSLYVFFNVAAGSWSTCSLFYDTLVDWSASSGLSFYLHANRAEMEMDVFVYSGTQEETESYLVTMQTTPGMVDGWEQVIFPWEQFLRADWEANAGTPLDPHKVIGMSFGFDAAPESPHAGEVWVDEVALHGMIAPAIPATEVPGVPETPMEPAVSVEPTLEVETERQFCPSSLAFTGILAVLVFSLRRKYK